MQAEETTIGASAAVEADIGMRSEQGPVAPSDVPAVRRQRKQLLSPRMCQGLKLQSGPLLLHALAAHLWTPPEGRKTHADIAVAFILASRDQFSATLNGQTLQRPDSSARQKNNKTSQAFICEKLYQVRGLCHFALLIPAWVVNKMGPRQPNDFLAIPSFEIGCNLQK